MKDLLLGEQPSLSALFPERVICLTDKHRVPHTTPHPHGTYFLGGLPGSITWKPEGALYTRPTVEVIEAVAPRCTNGSIGGFEVVRSLRWKEKGVMLVVAHDSYHIAAPWLALVPYQTDQELEAWIAAGACAPTR